MIVKEYPSLTKLHWEEDVKAVRAEWTTFSIKLDQFKEILDFYLNYASEKKIKNWIVDSANTVGFVSDEINAWLQSEWFPLALKKGITAFITIVPKSAITQLSNDSWQATIGEGFTVLNVANLDEAKKWIKENS